MLPAVRRQRSRDLHAFVVRLGLGRRIPKVNIHTRDFFFYVCHCRAYNMSVGNNSEPCLCLRVDLKPFEECSDDWELKQNVPIITQIRTPTCQEAKPSPRLHGIFNQVGKTLNMVQRAFNFGEDGSTSLQPPRPPLSDSEFRTFLDPVGQIIYAKELRTVIYFGGIDPGLRYLKHFFSKDSKCFTQVSGKWCGNTC
jgi:hypothetical protein